jgi:hypothetical protein
MAKRQTHVFWIPATERFARRWQLYPPAMGSLRHPQETLSACGFARLVTNQLAATPQNNMIVEG